MDFPELPPNVRGTAAAFHQWCGEELRRRRTRDVELVPKRYLAATRLVLARLGVSTPAGQPTDGGAK